MNVETFSFAKLDERIEKIPDAPDEFVLFPKELMVWEAIGVGGTVMGLLPSLFVLLIKPAQWMVVFATIGLLIMIVGFLPGFVRTCWFLIRDMWHWRARFIGNTDYAFDQHRELIQWLMQFPKKDLEEYAQFIRDARMRMGDKLGLIVGGMQRGKPGKFCRSVPWPDASYRLQFCA